VSGWGKVEACGGTWSISNGGFEFLCCGGVFDWGREEETCVTKEEAIIMGVILLGELEGWVVAIGAISRVGDKEAFGSYGESVSSSVTMLMVSISWAAGVE